MSRESNSRLLLLRGNEVSQRDVTEAIDRAGLALSVSVAGTRREFLDELRRGSVGIVVAGDESFSDLDLHEVLERARYVEPPVPVVIVGSHASEADSQGDLGDGATEYLATADIGRLPSALTRAFKRRESSANQVRMQSEIDRAAAMLRENQKLITVGRLASSIAHEINNPLESVTNLLYLLGEERDLSGAAREYLALAQRELERVAQISRQTLNFSRETVSPVRTHLQDLVEEVLALYNRRIAEKHIRVDRQYHAPEDAMVYPGEMRQVFSNLIANAIEASSPRGRLRIRVRSSRSWSDPGVRGVRVSVGDNGSGIQRAVLRRIGEPFFTTKGQRGTGLGLWVTRSIIQRYGGEMHLRSSTSGDRHGTVFSIFLPTNLRPMVVQRQGENRTGDGGASSVPVRGASTTRLASPEDSTTGDCLMSAMPLQRMANGH